VIPRNPLQHLFVSPKLGDGRLEQVARVVTAALVLGFVGVLLVLALRPIRSGTPSFELVARQPAVGGWSRDRIIVNQGERVRLRIRSEDVVHGFAIGRLGVEAGPIEPGKVTTVEFVANEAGEFTFYCTMWCDRNHPRMRGVLEVRGPSQPPTSAETPASDVALQYLDDPRDAKIVPSARPSSVRGEPLYQARCASCHSPRGEGSARTAGPERRTDFQDQSPVGIFRMLATEDSRPPPQDGPHGHNPTSPQTVSHEKFVRGWTPQDRWDVVAVLWSFRTTPERLDLGRRLFLKNCAACHGERGASDGPGGTRQPKKPADFTDARRMLAGTSGLYTAKIRRGGMGTGMPYWGSIFAEGELAALVSYVWTFSLGEGE
jgi:mono/diheme cytochrome c family protein